MRLPRARQDRLLRRPAQRPPGVQRPARIHKNIAALVGINDPPQRRPGSSVVGTTTVLDHLLDPLCLRLEMSA